MSVGDIAAPGLEQGHGREDVSRRIGGRQHPRSHKTTSENSSLTPKQRCDRLQVLEDVAVTQADHNGSGSWTLSVASCHSIDLFRTATMAVWGFVPRLNPFGCVEQPAAVDKKA